MSETEFFSFKDPYVGKVIAGEFRIEEQIGAGGMGSVYRAVQAVTERQVAVKILHRHLLSETVVQRFRQEARIISKLNHPNIVTVFKYGQHDDGALYIAMELATGRELTALIQAKAMTDPRRALPLMIQMADAVGYAHDMKIVHRDLKPENMIVGRPGRDERVKILDFGIAKIIDTKYVVTKTGMLCGSPPYMAPEQWEQVRDLDGRTDIYALGCVYYTMITGRLPYSADSTPGYMSLHLAGGPVPPIERNEALRRVPALNDIILRAMARDRADRFPDAYALREALEEVHLTLRAGSGSEHGVVAIPGPSKPDASPPASPAPPAAAAEPPADARDEAPDAARETPTGGKTIAMGSGPLPAADATGPAAPAPDEDPAQIGRAATISDSSLQGVSLPRATTLDGFGFEGEGTSIHTVPRTVASGHGDPSARRVHRLLVTAGLLLLGFLAASFSYFTWISPSPAPDPSPEAAPTRQVAPRAARATPRRVAHRFRRARRRSAQPASRRVR